MEITMKIKAIVGICALSSMVGCASYNANPYTALADNQHAIQEAAKKANGGKVGLETITLKDTVSPSLTCRAAGPVNPAPGKTVQQYIEEALKMELYMGGVYVPEARNRIRAQLTSLGFSSVGDAHWALGLHLASDSLPQGYNADVKYPFSASFFADYACRDVAEAFAPAVQQLVRKAVTAPEFQQLIAPLAESGLIQK